MINATEALEAAKLFGKIALTAAEAILKWATASAEERKAMVAAAQADTQELVDWHAGFEERAQERVTKALKEAAEDAGGTEP